MKRTGRVEWPVLVMSALVFSCFFADRAEAQFWFRKRDQANQAANAPKPSDPGHGSRAAQGDLNHAPGSAASVDQPLDFAKKIQFQIDMGRMQESGGQVEAALAAYEKALEAVRAEAKKPFHRRDLPAIEAGVVHRMAVANDRLGRFPVAQELYEKALKSKPQDARIWNDAGYSASQQGHWQEAERKLRQALKLQPNDPRVTNNLGIALAAQGKSDEAITLMSRVGGPAAAHANVGYVLASLGKTTEAKDHYRRSLRMQPGLTQAEEALARLELAEGTGIIATAPMSTPIVNPPGRPATTIETSVGRTATNNSVATTNRSDAAVQRSGRPVPEQTPVRSRVSDVPGISRSIDPAGVPPQVPVGAPHGGQRPEARTDTGFRKTSFEMRLPATAKLPGGASQPVIPKNSNTVLPNTAIPLQREGSAEAVLQPMDPLPIARSNAPQTDRRNIPASHESNTQSDSHSSDQTGKRFPFFKFPWSK